MEPVILRPGFHDNRPEARLYYGIDVISGLRILPDNSVHCAATSPPYWGLRDYGTEPVVWGGDLTCDHEWFDTSVTRKGSTNGRIDLGSTLISANGPKTLAPGLDNDPIGTKQYRTDGMATCHKCGAWKGHLGLEPTPQMFIQHLVQIFREVKRVLRSDGVLWLNLGDCFAQARGHGHWECRDGKGDESGQKATQLWAGKDASDIGLKPKDLIGIPWRAAFALQDDGWWLRSCVCWEKPNALPEPVIDRPTQSHEYLFLLTKSARYYYDHMAVRENATRDKSGCKDRRKYESGENQRVGTARGESIPWINTGDGRNLRSVWSIPTQPYPGSHFATWPTTLVERLIKTGSSEKGCCPICGAPWVRVLQRTDAVDERACGSRFDKGKTVARLGGERTQPGERYLQQMTGWQPSCGCPNNTPTHCTILDPFSGSGTTGYKALQLGRNYIGIDLNPTYLEMAIRRISGEPALKEPDDADTSFMDTFGTNE